MNVDTALGNIGSYLLVISALALGVERVMDLGKLFFKKHLVRKLATGSGELAKDATETKTEDPNLEKRRARLVRVWAMVVAVPLAFVAQVDSFALLGIASPMWLRYPILGWVLSGLAASRGSAFWHDVIQLVHEIKNKKQELAPSGS